MKRFLLVFCAVTSCACFFSQAQVDEVVPLEVKVSAREAVQKLGLEMMKGNFKHGHDRMYPRWKNRLAIRMGGMEKLEDALAKALQQNVMLQIQVSAFEAREPEVVYSVWRAPTLDPVTKQPMLDADGKRIITENWLVIVPTTTQVKIPDKQLGGKIRTLEENSYTIAISEKGKNEWYFLTGLKPTVQDLRSLFPTLPADEKEIGFPPSSMKEIK